MSVERGPTKESENWFEKILAPIINIINTWFENLKGSKGKNRTPR
jgi:hypothetical protein